MGGENRREVNPYNRKLFSKKTSHSIELKVVLNAPEADYSSEKYLKWKNSSALKKK